jgi:hypothetical protein
VIERYQDPFDFLIVLFSGGYQLQLVQAFPSNPKDHGDQDSRYLHLSPLVLKIFFQIDDIKKQFNINVPSTSASALIGS